MSALARIFEVKREEVEAARRLLPLAEVRARAADADAPRGFRRGLVETDRPVALIGEVKKASPSKGVIRADFDAVAIAREYEAAGAHALSVLTDGPHFQGSPENLTRARAATKLPVLRKDFLFDPYQVYEARAWGADAVLLIVAELERSALEELGGLARELGMDVLVEVHADEEAELALALRCDLIGVNNRDLSTFSTSLEVSERLLPRVAGEALAVSESALESSEDIERVRRAGARAVLIGTTFCASPDVQSKVREVMRW